MSYSDKLSNAFNIYTKNLGRLIMPSLMVFIAKVILAIILFAGFILSIPFTRMGFGMFSILAFGAVAVIATLIMRVIIAFIFAAAIIAIIELSRDLLAGIESDGLKAFTDAFKKPYYVQATVATLAVSIIVGLAGIVNTALGYVLAGILYPPLVYVIMFIMDGKNISDSVGLAVNEFMKIINKDVAAGIIIFFIAILSHAIILDIFAIPFLVLYLVLIKASTSSE